MLEGLVAWVLNNYLGKYVENLNTDQLSVALLSGKVELENLPLKKDALRHLGLPVEIKAGFIGKVQLQVPVRQIRSAPWLIAIDKLYLVAAPVNLDEWDAASEAVFAHERKVALLDALEAQWRADHEASDAGYYATSYSSWLTYGTGLLANIVENLQLTLTDVHIRYEDCLTCAPSSAFACGLTVESLTAESCDSEWRPGFTLLQDPDGCSFKLLELHKLAVYWDPMAVPGGMLAHCQIPELTERMRAGWQAAHRYLLPPADARARVRRERTELPLRSRSRPRLTAHLTLDCVALALTSRQYGEALGCALGLERTARLRDVRARRPPHAVRAHARDWWIYALSCHVPNHAWTEPRATWESCVSAARGTRRYVDTCVRALAQPAATLPADLQAAKDEFEWRTPLPVLKALREVAMRKVPKSSACPAAERAPPARSMLVHWFPQWWGWYGAPGAAPDAAPPAAPPDLEEEILDVIADSLDDNTLLKRDTVFGKFEFELNEGSLVLSMEDDDSDRAGEGGQLELQWSGLRLGVESRPRSSSHALHVSLGALRLHDRVTRDTLFPVLLAPHGLVREGLGAPPARARAPADGPEDREPLFRLVYEKKPLGLNCDYKLWVKSEALEVVYSAGVAAWAQQFAARGGGAGRAWPAMHVVREGTRARLRTHWERMLRAGRRRAWHVELDVSAPQILVPEAPGSRDAALLLVDFGRLRLTNAEAEAPSPPTPEDEERFVTPCSTPPGSLQSPAAGGAAALDAAALHTRLYERYLVELSALQVLVGRGRDAWQFALARASSPLHLLDRFSISLRAERRAVHTADPHFPSAALCGELPALTVHLSEHKLQAVRAVLARLPPLGLARAGEAEAEERAEEEEDRSQASDTERSEASGGASSHVMVQFGVEQLSLEVQSRGRSIAEVQVCGVRCAACWRPRDSSLALSVHSLLLVDALQTYGPDFELLVASHKHVGMDTASGSIRGSEPTSPTSPTSPRSCSPPPPLALSHALHALRRAGAAPPGEPDPERRSPAWGRVGEGGGAECPGAGWGGVGLVDSEALIAVELCFVKGDGDAEDLRIANILFNNLDIIANQETIVELIGFAQRVLAPAPGERPRAAPPPHTPDDHRYSDDGLMEKETRTEITFDFHRLGVLLLRAAVEDGAVVARKIATATLAEARIQATVAGGGVQAGGSLGGVQVVSLCERGGPHTRVLRAGRHARERPQHEPERALTFTIGRRVAPGAVHVDVAAEVASVWYTHSPALLGELRSCLDEFKQYLANLARSIRAAAADMALGLVQPREGFAARAAGDTASPRRRTVSAGASLDEPAPAIVLSVCVELQSPVAVVPRAARSPHVLLAHLGRMSLSNRPGPPRATAYTVRIRDVSLVTLDVSEKLRRYRLTAETMPTVYCAADGRPVLHDTALQFAVECADGAAGVHCAVSGGVVGPLQVSARRDQYEQLLDTLRWAAAGPPAPPAAAAPPAPPAPLAPALEPAVPVLRLDPAVRAAVLAVPRPGPAPAPPPPALTVAFELPVFSVELRADLGAGERSLVELSFREFALHYRRVRLESTLQVSLHSIAMEDLTQAPDARHRLLLVSHPPQPPPKAVFVSASCPDLRAPKARAWRSLPDRLHVAHEKKRDTRQNSKCGPTPPCSPECEAEPEDAAAPEERPAGDDNLVWVWVHTRDPAHPRFNDTFDRVSKLTKVEFNRLNLVVSIDSWVAVLDFFGFTGDDAPQPEPENVQDRDGGAEEGGAGGVTQTEMSIRSLGVVVVGGRGEACRARVSRVAVRVRGDDVRRTRDISGRLGALALHDLTPHAPQWRRTLSTHSPTALTFSYRRLAAAEAAAAGHATRLQVELGRVTYVHTRRFVHELRAFAREFSLLRRVLLQARRQVGPGAGARAAPAGPLRLALACEAPLIVLPVSGRSRSALAVQLTRLTLDNTFLEAGAPGTVSSLVDPECPRRELLDVRTVRLEALALHGAEGGRGGRGLRLGAPLLTAPTHLTLQIEYNMSDTHNVADMTAQGTLTTLEAALGPAQYRLVRGVLAHNLAEPLDDLPPQPPPAAEQQERVWTTSSLKLELQDVRVRLSPEAGPRSLACINFIKSRLHLDTYSDLSQDIDLVSQEILVSDTRYEAEPANRRGNVFSHIAQPMADHRHSVQAEVHARKRADSSAYTILVNNMRLMAVLDWWERVYHFLNQPPHAAADDKHDHHDTCSAGAGGAASGAGGAHMELKLNITDSQLVLVEDPSLWDTNAVILRSTTVVTYRSGEAEKPVSCSLNELEVFSCVLGLEDETALAILEPAALHAVLRADGVLHVSTSTLDLRLSYHDMRMFAAMLHSLPAQARAALSGNPVSACPCDEPANSVHMHPARPTARCVLAPRWVRPAPAPRAAPAPPVRAVHLSADCITLCVIDDCLDSDVPLLEVVLADLSLEQDLRKAEDALGDPVLVSTPGAGPAGAGGVGGAGGAGAGRLAARLSVDYYNRPLSGWEPAVEPWRFAAAWEYALSGELAPARVQVRLESDEVLDTNVTSAMIELARVVRANWAADYYGGARSPAGSPAGPRRRSPFVPYALRNLTGQRLWFTPLVSPAEELARGGAGRADDGWVCVGAGHTEPFSFGARWGRARARRLALLQLALRLERWLPPEPVCVDRVGVFFRSLAHAASGAEARLVFEVSLEGSARKLVTVRSALQLVNRLPHAVEVRLDHAAAGPWRAEGAGGAAWTVGAGDTWAAPLVERAGALRVRVPAAAGAAPLPAVLDWRASRRLLHCECRTPPDNVYRFCCSVVREGFPPDAGEPVAGHTLTLVPALRLENLLPLELQYRLQAPRAPITATAAPGDTHPFHQVNVEEGVELSVKLEGFGWSTALSVGGGGAQAGSFSARLKLRDTRGRRLYLNARVSVGNTDGIKVSVSAAYWLVNRTGLPLVFRAEGGAEAAGQAAEHEVARCVAPLLFSFAEAEGGPTLAARLGHAVPGTPEWCSPFGLGVGVGVKKLEVRGEGEGADRVYAVGVSVRAGRGRYRHTNIVTFTPRYQLHNNTSYDLQFAQKCCANTLTDPGCAATHVTAVAGCWLPWHWARWEREQLVCVRVVGAEGQGARTHWSGGFRVEAGRALTLACRARPAGYVFVRVEVAAQGAALLVVLTDAEGAPPPLALHNHSAVAVMFAQVGAADEGVLGARGRARWALPEPEGAAALALRAPGGPRTTLPLDALGSTHYLLYQNFIYVAFTATAVGRDDSPAEDNVLVLEVPLGTTRVVLAHKKYGDRSQLWRRAAGGQLVHEGSSVPQQDAPGERVSPHALVLDIEDAAPRPDRPAPLALRRADPRRASTQAWRLRAGRMQCAHSNLCVQPAGRALLALAPGARAVLALPARAADRAPPPEQAVGWQWLRPGSGRLAVSLAADGPTRLVVVRDAAGPPARLDAAADEEDAGPRREWGLRVALHGLSVSLVERAELVHALFSGVSLEVGVAPAQVAAALAVRDMQWDNQLPNTPSPVLLYCPPASAPGPALHAAAELQRAASRRYNAYFFKHLAVGLRPLAVRLEERLILQLWAWLWPESGEAREQPDEAEFETRRMLDELTALHATRYYFALIKIMPSQIRLSMCTANKLEGSLSALKRRLGLTLIKFEDAAVELEPFVRTHVFDTATILARQLLQHFKDELKWQAAKILGSVDFLGNPLGFVADVSEGVSGLLLEGNVGALLKNVTHGISNSAAKVSESLGDGLERVVGDEAHEETRRRIRSAAGGGHLAAGLRGLGLGILGGVTSLVKHSYEGAAQEGLGGFLTGVGKGLVGTVTKPVIGVLDLAAETASALRDTSRRADRWVPARAREPRGGAAGALLPRYCAERARAAQLLVALSGGDHEERLLAWGVVRGPPHDIRALLSDRQLRVFTCKHGAPHVLMETPLANLVAVTAVRAADDHFVELAVRAQHDAVRRPRVQCDDAQLAQWLARHAAYARQLHHEHVHTLRPLPDQ